MAAALLLPLDGGKCRARRFAARTPLPKGKEMNRRRFNIVPAVTLLVAVGWVSDAAAACTGASPTWTSTPDRSSISSCLATARDGDVINVQAGTASWSPSLSITKKVTLAGAGAGNTIINGTFTITGAGARITGFTINVGSAYNSIEWSVGFRIDHNIINHTAPSDFNILAYGDATTAVEGLIDNNTLTNGKVVYFGSHGDAGAGSARWGEPLNIGTSHALYVEDNTFNLPDVNSYNNSIDGNWGSRTVVRFNRFVDGRIEQHSLQGDNQRAVRLWEIYNNTFTSPDWANYRPYFIRGGTGFVFHNTSDGKYINNTVDIDNARSSEGSIASQITSFGFCDGSSRVDGNTSGQQGWPCRDQIGRSTDSSPWTNYASAAPPQASQPAYFWRNTEPSGETPVGISCEANDARCTRQNTLHLVANRDFYSYQAAFSGTQGVGEGTLAQRPATCTTGVAYWVTDQGEWNSRHAGPDGQLYRCSATNTWTVLYTPYSYPHPLQNSMAPAPPSAPSNLRIVPTR
jgi:hypothetical protein